MDRRSKIITLRYPLLTRPGCYSRTCSMFGIKLSVYPSCWYLEFVPTIRHALAACMVTWMDEPDQYSSAPMPSHSLYLKTYKIIHNLGGLSQCILFSVVFTAPPPSHHGRLWLLTVISLLLTNTVSPVRACLSI
jgi:hypothetical protein